MATMMMSNHYASQPSAHYAYGQPQGPPSPPMDETSKCSLPSISNLLGLADGGSPTTEHSPASQQGKRHRRDQFQRPLTYRPASSHKPDARPDSSHYNNVFPRSGALPPTPPMSSDASFEGYHSPSTKSVSQLSAASNYFYDTAPAMAHVESEAQRQQMAPRPAMHVPAYAQSAFAASSYMGPPAMASYYPAMQPTPPPQAQVSGLYYQRPLPHVSTVHLNKRIEYRLTFQSGIPSNAAQRCDALVWLEPLATPPLHLALFSGIFPPVTGSLYLPDLQQGLLQAQFITHSQPLSYRREALQVPSRRLWQSLQRSQQHEETRARLPQL